MTDDRRRYRLSPRDNTGWAFGLSGTQCIGLAIGLSASGLALNAGAVWPVTLLPFVLGITFAFGRWNGDPLHCHLGTWVRWSMLRLLNLTQWHSTHDDAAPPFLAHLGISELPAPDWLARIDDAGIGVVVDQPNATVSATVPVRARSFSLCEQEEQERLLDRWGDVLGAFATERNTVRQVIWQERACIAAPQGPTHLARRTPALVSYDELIADRRREAEMHETSITISVDLRKVRGTRNIIDAGMGVLADELRLLTNRLNEAGFEVDAPLSETEIHHAVAVRLDPAPGEASTGRTLAQLVGAEGERRLPDSFDLKWNWAQTGGSYHHTYAVREWSRLDLPTDWMEPLIFGSQGTRTLTFVAEPVAPSRSRQQVDRDATKLSTDEAQRTRAGFRIGADHKRSAEAVLEREQELASGFVEFTYVGLVTLSADSPEALRSICIDYEQHAAQSGVALQSLDARHDFGLACSLPAGIAPRTRRLS